MKRLLGFCVIAGTVAFAHSQQATQDIVDSKPCQVESMKGDLTDWADLSRYRLANAALSPPTQAEPRVIFFGSSTTENWGRKYDSVFFPDKPYINRGISGQTTPQMLVRFWQDVIALRPAAVVFLGGTNDVAGNTGPMTLEMIEDNIRSMVAIAQAYGVKMILASQLPVKEFFWNKSCHGEPELLSLSDWERKFASEQHLGYVDYYSVLADSDGGFRSGLSQDGVHPNKKAYELMAPVVEAVIEHVLTKP